MFERYGPLLTLSQLAQILNRSTDGIRITLRDPTPASQKLSAAKVHIGRRLYFRTLEIAEIILSGA